MKLLVLADGRNVARFRDPLTGKSQQQSLDLLGLTSKEARRQWAMDKALSLAATKAAIASGRAVAAKVAVAAATDTFLQGYTKQSTVDGYRVLLDRFVEWSSGVGVTILQDLAAPHLAQFHDDYQRTAVAAPVRGGKRGAKRASTGLRAPASVNKAFTVVKAFLGWARRRGWTPKLNGDDIRDHLRPVKVPREAIRYLEPPQLKKLLESALRHDRAVFKLTRAEHGGVGEAGTTARYDPIAPFLLCVLLTGCRFQELAGLRWEEVNLPGECIKLPAVRVKTGHARTVGLRETPSVLSILRALDRQKGGALVFSATKDFAKAARRRLVGQFGAPEFTWHDLRRTCGTILTCAPGIYSGASAFLSAKRLGHSVAVAEKHYVGVLTGLPTTATTLEAAAGIAEVADRVVAAVEGESAGVPGEPMAG